MPFSPALQPGCKQEHDGTHFHMYLGSCLLKEVMATFYFKKTAESYGNNSSILCIFWCLSLSNPVILISVLYQTPFQNVPSFNISSPPKQEYKSLLSASQSSLTLPRHHLGRHSAHEHIKLRSRECSDVCSDVRD